MPDSIGEYTVVVLVTDAANLDETQAGFARTVIASHPRVVSVARRTPYDIREFTGVGTYLCCWSINHSSSVAVAEAITGRSPITGRLPVSFDDVPLGAGIDLP
jgi:beta-N-acetylhexosaminidase